MILKGGRNMAKKEKEQTTGAEEAILKPDPAKEGDSIRISSEVVAVIAGIVSSDIPGIAGMSGGLVGGIAEKLGRKDLTKGIKVHVEGEVVTIDMNVIAEYGTSIVEATDQLKKAIRGSVEKTTGLTVRAININVLGINIPGEESPVEKKDDHEGDKK
jgi:uncharacterized alkaline shock family protein YloU